MIIYNLTQPIYALEHHTPYNQITAQNKLLVAWHEAGHLVSYMHNHSLHMIQHATIKPDSITKSQGHVQIMRISNIERSIEQLENDIISALCGGVSEQIALKQKMFSTHQEILDYFTHERFTTDIEIARKDAREMITFDCIEYKEQQMEQKINGILVRLYCKAYQFIYTHQQEVKRIADALLDQQTLSDDEAYNLVL